MRLLRLALVLLAWPAAAWPVDWIHDVAVGKERFVRLPQLDWFEVEDPKVAGVEWLAGSQELLLSGLKAGRTLVLLGAEGKVAVWRVRVGTEPLVDPRALGAAQKACPELKTSPLDDVKLAVRVRDEPCHQALAALLETDAFEARHLEVTFEGLVLQAQLRGLQAGLKASVKSKVSARYVGAGLVLEGTVTEAEHRRALWEVFRRTLGRLALDDRLSVVASDQGH